MRTPKLALSWARDQVARPTQDWTRLCLSFVRQAYGLPVVWPRASVAWEKAKLKHPTSDASTIPAGVPVFWAPNHVAISTGGGMCISTDARRKGKPDPVAIDSLTSQWGLTLLGWTEDLNGTGVWKPAPKANRVRGARNKLREARQLVREAASELEDVPDSRTVVHNVAESLDSTIAKITRQLERMPKS